MPGTAFGGAETRASRKPDLALAATTDAAGSAKVSV